MKDLTEEEKKIFKNGLYHLTKAIDAIGEITEALINLTMKKDDLGSSNSRNSSDSGGSNEQPIEQKETRGSKQS